MRILVLASLYPPHHAGTYDLRCQTFVDAMRTRGHTLHVLTSTHGIGHEQRGGDVERRFQLNGVFDHPLLTEYKELKALEVQNHAVLQETIAEFQPELIFVSSLQGLSKSIVFALQNSRIPTVYAVDNYWLAREVAKDPWLRWWNSPKLSTGASIARTSLELAGQRSKIDEIAPTRASKADHRMPQLFDNENPLGTTHPNSLISFRFEHIYFCSQTVKFASESAGFRVSHGEVIYPGVPTESFFAEVKPVSAPLQRFLLVGKLDAQSGALTAMKALRAFRTRGGNAVLGVYGRGDSDYMALVRSEVATHQLPVEFLPYSNMTRELPAIYRRHDALLYTAEWNEPFSSTPLEAMAAGLPVIGTAIGGVGEIFREAQNSLTYGPGDSEVLASRMHQLQQDAKLRCEIAEAGQQEVMSQFNESAVTDKIETYLQTALGGQPE